MLHDVHLYVTVRVKVYNIEADTHKAAIEAAEEEFHKRDLFRDQTSAETPDDPRTDIRGLCAIAGYAEEIGAALVDEVGDVNFEKSRHYDFPSPSRVERTLLEVLIEALPYVEMAEHDASYKPGAVKKMVTKMRAAIAAAEPAKEEAADAT